MLQTLIIWHRYGIIDSRDWQVLFQSSEEQPCFGLLCKALWRFAAFSPINWCKPGQLCKDLTGEERGQHVSNFQPARGKGGQYPQPAFACRNMVPTSRFWGDFSPCTGGVLPGWRNTRTSLSCVCGRITPSHRYQHLKIASPKKYKVSVQGVQVSRKVGQT